MIKVRAYVHAFTLGGLIFVAGQGCMPAVMHSPRIDPGLTTGLVGPYTAGPRTTRGDMGGAAYAQLPRRALLGLDGGVGVALIPVAEITMPYGQLGVLRADGSGLFATYGFLIGPDPSNVNPAGRDAGADVPGIAFQSVNGRTTTRFFVTAAIARERECPEGTDCSRPDDWSVATGVALEFRHRKRE